MKKLIVTLFLSAFCVVFVYSQKYVDYFKYVNSAELKTLDYNYQESLQYYDSAFTTGISMPIHLRNAFYESAKLELFNLSVELLDELVSKGVKVDSYINRMENKEDFIVSTYYLDFKKTYRDELNKAQENFNDTIIDLLKTMAIKDQELRRISYKKNDSLIFSQIKTIDTTNLRLLMNIVEKYGWPNYGIVGTKYSGAANIILLHGIRYFSLDSYEWLFFENILKQEIYQGNFYPITLAQWTDQHLIMIEKVKQKYGSIANSSGIILPIENFTKVDVLRKEICLEPLSDYLRKKHYKIE